MSKQKNTLTPDTEQALQHFTTAASALLDKIKGFNTETGDRLVFEHLGVTVSRVNTASKDLDGPVDIYEAISDALVASRMVSSVIMRYALEPSDVPLYDRFGETVRNLEKVTGNEPAPPLGSEGDWPMGTLPETDVAQPEES